jgi:hypothetical protein
MNRRFHVLYYSGIALPFVLRPIGFCLPHGQNRFACISIAYVALVFARYESALAQPMVIDPIEARDRVLAAFAENYESYRTVRGVLHFQKTWSDEVKALFLKSSEKRGPGIKLSPIEEQLAPRQIRFSIKGNRIRFDGSTSSAEHIIITDRDTFSYYSAEGKSLWVRAYNTPFHLSRDPREIFLDDSLRWEDVLLKASLGSAKKIDSRTSQGEAVVLSFTTVDKVEFQVECTEERSWLPVRYLERSGTPDNMQVISGEMSYQQLEFNGHKAWFPLELVHKFWGSSRQPHDVNEDLTSKWASKESYLVQEVTVNVPISDEDFKIQPVDGTLLTNAVEKKRTVVGEDLGHMTGHQRSWWIVFLNVAVIALLIALIARRKLLSTIGKHW